jgi:hypothetical protein
MTQAHAGQNPKVAEQRERFRSDTFDQSAATRSGAGRGVCIE